MSSLRRAIWKSSNLILVLCAASAAGAEEWLNPSGSLRAGYFAKDKTFSDERDFAAASAWMTLRPREVLGVKTYFDGVLYNENGFRAAPSYGDLREGYAESSLGRLDFKVGRTITVWGRADKVNPTDNLSTRDYTRLVTDDEDQRTGVFSTQVIYNLDSIRLIGIWLPEWRDPKFPLPVQPGLRMHYRSPELRTEQFALKVDQAGGAVDWSLSYFHGYSKTPDFSLVSAGANGVDLDLLFRRVNVYGGDFAFNVDSFGVRGEAALTTTEDSGGDDPMIQNRNLFAVLGVDRTFSEHYNVNAQVLYRHVYDFHAGDSVLAAFENINTQQLAADQVGFSLRPSVKFYNDTLEAEVAFVYWGQRGDSLTRPKLTYAVSDSLKVIVGGEIYGGPQDSFFGRMSGLSGGFSELRWGF